MATTGIKRSIEDCSDAGSNNESPTIKRTKQETPTSEDVKNAAQVIDYGGDTCPTVKVLVKEWRVDQGETFIVSQELIDYTSKAFDFLYYGEYVYRKEDEVVIEHTKP